MKLPDLEAWAIFASVVEHGSFTEAAAAIGVSKATVSKAIARLETSLGQSLFHRTSRRLALTEAARPLAERAQRILAEATCAEEAARDAASAPAGHIRVAAPMSFGTHNVTPLIVAFLAQHPAITIDLQLSDARVDIVAEGFDLALRIADLPDSSLRARRLCGIRTPLVAAPAYLEAHGTPRHPGELAAHRLLGYTNVAGPLRFRHRDGTEVSIPVDGPLYTNAGEAMRAAAIAGLGIVRLPDFLSREALAAGALVEVLPDWTPPPIGLHLLTPPSPLRPARVEALIAYLGAALKPRDPASQEDAHR